MAKKVHKYCNEDYVEFIDLTLNQIMEILRDLVSAIRYHTHIRLNNFYYYCHIKPLGKDMVKDLDYSKQKFNSYELKKNYDKRKDPNKIGMKISRDKQKERLKKLTEYQRQPSPTTTIFSFILKLVLLIIVMSVVREVIVVVGDGCL